MPEDTPVDPRHPRVRMQGPRPTLPPVGEPPPDLPYSGEPASRPRWAAFAVLALLGIVVAAVAIFAAAGNDGGDGSTAARSPSNPPGASSPAATALTTTTTEPETTRTRASSSTKTTATTEAAATKKATTTKKKKATAKATTTTTKATTTRPPTTTTTTTKPPAATPKPTVPLDQLPPHEAVYKDGKLILQGTLPNRKVADQFREKAAEVIGPQNVIVRYQYDSRVPVPTDGHVRVAEQFIFPKNSATVNPGYFQVFDLGVAVLKINPQATMRIRGYTDDSGPPEVNHRLSQERAQAAANYLIFHGIDAKRLTVVGFGEADPAVPNDSEANRAQNRRIQVDLYNLLAA